MRLLGNIVNKSFYNKIKEKTTKRTRRPTPLKTEIRCFPLRLGPGVELVSTIHELMNDIGVQSLFVLSCVGSISSCSSKSFELNENKYDIVSLSGTFDKNSHNLMGSLSNRLTGQLIGGSIDSLFIDKTCELMLAEPLDCYFIREFDHRTGQNELVVKGKTITDL